MEEMDIIQCLTELSLACGPSGRERGESSVLEQAKFQMGALMDSSGKPVFQSVYTDRFGNLIGCRPCGMPNAKRVVLDAHLDEVGLLITGAKEGFLTFRSVGGVDPRMLPNRDALPA